MDIPFMRARHRATLLQARAPLIPADMLVLK